MKITKETSSNSLSEHYKDAYSELTGEDDVDRFYKTVSILRAETLHHQQNHGKGNRHKYLHLPVPAEAERPKLIDQAEESLSDAIIQLLSQQPFFGQLLCGMKQVPTWSIPTMGVDGIHLFYNPSFVLVMTKPERRGVMCHETLHLALRHIQRKRQRAHKLWNAACDYAVNLIIKDDLDMKLPDFVLYRADFKDLSAEEIFVKLLEERENQPKSGKQKQKGSGSGEGGEGESDCPYCQEESEGDGDGDGDGDLDSFDSHIFNPELDEDALTDRIVRASEAAKRRGKMPAGLERLVNKLRESKVDWRTLIRGRALDVFQKVDYHPELRSILTGSICGGRTWIPGLAKEEASILVLVVDTSGSISPDILNAFGSEIKEVASMADKTILISCDAAVHECVEVGKFDEIFDQFKAKGGGGTDFRPAFDKVREMGINPNLFVYFTDGYGVFPDQMPDYPVLWAFTKQHADAPWGESVTVDAAEY